MTTAGNSDVQQMEMNIVVFAKLFADTRKLRAIKPCAEFCGGIMAQKCFDPLLQKKSSMISR